MSAPDQLSMKFSSKAAGLDLSDSGLEDAGYSSVSPSSGLIDTLAVKPQLIAPLPSQRSSSEQNNNSNPKAQEFTKVASSSAPVGNALGKGASEKAVDNRADSAMKLSRNFAQQAEAAKKQPTDNAPVRSSSVAGVIADQAMGPLKMAGAAAIGGAIGGPGGAAVGVGAVVAADVASLLKSALVGQGTFGQTTGRSYFEPSSTKSRDGGSVGYVASSSASATPAASVPAFNTSSPDRSPMGIAEINIASDGLNGNTKPGAFDLRNTVFAKSLEGMMKNVREVAASKGIDTESKGYNKPLDFEAPPLTFKTALAVPHPSQGRLMGSLL